MKTLNTLSALLLIFAGSASFANTITNDGGRSEKKLSVAVASYVYTSNDADIPAALEFLKAKSAFVPVAKYEFDDSVEAPAELDVKAVTNLVPFAPVVMARDLTVPLELALIKAKSALVPVAPIVWESPETPADLK